MGEIEVHEKLASVETTLRLVLTNHLPHIQESINRVEKKNDTQIGEVKEQVGKVDERTWWILGTLVFGFLALILVGLFQLKVL